MKKKTSSLRGQLGAALLPSTTNLPQTTLMLSQRRISQLGTIVSTSTILVVDSKLKLRLSTSQYKRPSGTQPVFSSRAARRVILTLANLHHNQMLSSHHLCRRNLVSLSNSSSHKHSSHRLDFLTSMPPSRQLDFYLHRIFKVRLQRSMSSRVSPLLQVSGNLVLLLRQHLHSVR